MNDPIVSQPISGDNVLSPIELEIQKLALMLKDFGFGDLAIKTLLDDISAKSALHTYAEVFRWMNPTEQAQWEKYTNDNKEFDLHLVEFDRLSTQYTGKSLEQLQNSMLHNLIISLVQELTRFTKYSQQFLNLKPEQSQKVQDLMMQQQYTAIEDYLNELSREGK